MASFRFMCFFVMSFSFLIVMNTPCAAQNTLQINTEDAMSAAAIAGIWENPNRFIEFSTFNEQNGTGIMRFVLKPYYTFFYDDTASYTYRYAQNLLEIQYPQTRGFTPIAVFIAENNEGQKSLYTEFLRNDAPSASAENSLAGFWRASGNVADISLMPPAYQAEVYSYYITETAVFRIRYWQVTVPYENIKAHISEKSETGENIYDFDKYIQIAGVVYTCVAGRNTQVRNIEKFSYEISDSVLILHDGSKSVKMPFVLSVSDGFLSFSQPYVVKSVVTDLNAEITAHNALRRPLRKPPLDFMDLDFHWDEIEKLRGGK